jgi:alkyl sulfatase BDS1-like metallo-beta-lactamase superfamily hydrolase
VAEEKLNAVKPATEVTRLANRTARDTLPLSDRRDFDDAARGFVGTLDDPKIRRADGALVMDLNAHDFLAESEDAPDTVHPSLWRHARVNRHRGLFKVTEGIYQVRGLDLANMTIVEGSDGIIVIDPLLFNETAGAGLALYRQHRGDRAVKALIYTHSHADHYGGAKAVLDEAEVAAGRATVIAPEGFLYESVAENIYAGTAMTRRAIYQYGPMLAPGTQGQVDAGLANVPANAGSASLIAPTDIVRATGEKRTVDGVEMVFQMAPATEAPSEFLIHFPQRRALCAAEDATHTMHNLYTLRGAQVRDAATWWKTLDETIELFGADTDVVFAQHNWPRWGTADISEFLANQRDLYKYLHDQSLRLANHGYTMTEIGEQLALPAGLAQQWYSHGYYGSVNHNAKAVYQRYLGWYDSHPAHLHPLPTEQAASRYVEFMGGPDAVVDKARAAFGTGDYRWVAEVLTHVVFAHPDHSDAALLQADALEQLGYQCENPTWRNEYLMGALELRNGVRDLGTIELATPDVLRAMTPEMIFDFLGIKLNGPEAAGQTSVINWTVTDLDAGPVNYSLQLRNGCLIYTPNKTDDAASGAVSSSKAVLAAVVFGETALTDAITSGDITVTGDQQPVTDLFGLLDDFPLWFNIVQP